MMVPKRQNVGKKTGDLTRATIYFSPDIHHGAAFTRRNSRRFDLADGELDGASRFG